LKIAKKRVISTPTCDSHKIYSLLFLPLLLLQLFPYDVFQIYDFVDRSEQFCCNKNY